MTNGAALETIRSLAAACAFVCEGDVMWAMGARCLSHDSVNVALSVAADCEPCATGWRVTTVDLDGEALTIEVRLDPPTVLGLR